MPGANGWGQGPGQVPVYRQVLTLPGGAAPGPRNPAGAGQVARPRPRRQQVGTVAGNAGALALPTIVSIDQGNRFPSGTQIWMRGHGFSWNGDGGVQICDIPDFWNSNRFTVSNFVAWDENTIIGDATLLFNFQPGPYFLIVFRGDSVITGPPYPIIIDYPVATLPILIRSRPYPRSRAQVKTERAVDTSAAPVAVDPLRLPELGRSRRPLQHARTSVARPSPLLDPPLSLPPAPAQAQGKAFPSARARWETRIQPAASPVPSRSIRAGRRWAPWRATVRSRRTLDSTQAPVFSLGPTRAQSDRSRAGLQRANVRLSRAAPGSTNAVALTAARLAVKGRAALGRSRARATRAVTTQVVAVVTAPVVSRVRRRYSFGRTRVGVGRSPGAVLWPARPQRVSRRWAPGRAKAEITVRSPAALAVPRPPAPRRPARLAIRRTVVRLRQALSFTPAAPNTDPPNTDPLPDSAWEMSTATMLEATSSAVYTEQVSTATATEDTAASAWEVNE